MYLAPRSRVIFFNYGAHFMAQRPSASPRPPPAAILIRALEPLDGIDRHAENAQNLRPSRSHTRPAALAPLFKSTAATMGLDLCGSGALWLGVTKHTRWPHRKSVRIGITRAADQLLRFYERGKSFRSGGPKRLLLQTPSPRNCV